MKYLILVLMMLIPACATLEKVDSKIQNIGSAKVEYDSVVYDVTFYKINKNGGVCQFKKWQ